MMEAAPKADPRNGMRRAIPYFRASGRKNAAVVR